MYISFELRVCSLYFANKYKENAHLSIVDLLSECDTLISLLTLDEENMTNVQTVGRTVGMVTALLLALLLVGAGCSNVTIDTDLGEDVSGSTDASEFTGLDGSLTEFAFDDVAEAFTEFLLLDPVTENPDQDVFEIWMEGEDALPVNDTFTNPIKLRSDEARMYVLWTEGEDGLADTDDDFFKTYRY